jgi:hypothetical protein
VRSNRTYRLFKKGFMAEWFKRGTVNTFYRGSIPLKTFKFKKKETKRKILKANMLKFGKQSSLKQKWEISLKSSSLFVRSLVSKIVSQAR